MNTAKEKKPVTENVARWNAVLRDLADGKSDESVSVMMEMDVDEWAEWLLGNPDKAKQVRNAKQLALGKIKERLMKDAMNGNSGAAKAVLEIKDEEFKKKSVNASGGGGIRLVVVTGFPERAAPLVEDI